LGNLFQKDILQRIFKELQAQRLREIALLTGSGDAAVQKSQADFPNLADLSKVNDLFGKNGLSGRVTFAAEDLFIRKRVEPLQAIFSQWMERAAAQVDGESIPFKEVITWCQGCHSWEKRRVLAKETLALCRFLAPFSHATWQALIATIKDELGYEDYLEFCQIRRKKSLEHEFRLCRSLLDKGRNKYMNLIDGWIKEVQPGHGLCHAIRFDAIYLLGMKYLDSYAEALISKNIATDFFCMLGIEEGPHLQIHDEGKSGRQSFCIPVSVPEEIHIIVGPVSSWLDWEALFHEMGHAFYFLNISPELPMEAREFFMSGAVSEAFAFLFQRLCMKRDFLQSVVNCDPSMSEILEKMDELKFMVLTRRYGAKFLIEYENFSRGFISRGQELYAEVMERETGFKYDPETYLFDLMPDFYSLDYFKAFLASEMMLKRLETSYGTRWFHDAEAQETLKGWAARGCLYELDEFMDKVVESSNGYH